MAADSVAPKARRLEEFLVLSKVEARAFETRSNSSQAHQPCFSVRQDDANTTAQCWWIVCRAVELAAADVNPHVARVPVVRNGSRFNPGAAT
jgi:hypothetical protein